MTNRDDELIELRTDVDKLRAQARALKTTCDRLRSQLETTNGQIQRTEDRSGKLFSDMAYTQQQLESVIGSLERERDIVADHTERLRILADESRFSSLRNSSSSSHTLLATLTHWLYTPTMHLVKVAYSLISPIAYTLHSLSLFNSEVSRQYAIFAEHEDEGTERKDDLLTQLQMGTFDPLLNQKG